MVWLLYADALTSPARLVWHVVMIWPDDLVWLVKWTCISWSWQSVDLHNLLKPLYLPRFLANMRVVLLAAFHVVGRAVASILILFIFLVFCELELMIFVATFHEHFGVCPVMFYSSRVNMKAVTFGNPLLDLDLPLMNEISRYYPLFLFIHCDEQYLLGLDGNWFD